MVSRRYANELVDGSVYAIINIPAINPDGLKKAPKAIKQIISLRAFMFLVWNK